MLLVAPTAYHRLVFRLHDKEAIVFVSSWLAVVGLLLVAAAMTAVVLLITDVIFSRERAYLVAAVTGGLFIGLWCLFPLVRRALVGGGESDQPPPSEPGGDGQDDGRASPERSALGSGGLRQGR